MLVSPLALSLAPFFVQYGYALPAVEEPNLVGRAREPKTINPPSRTSGTITTSAATVSNWYKPGLNATFLYDLESSNVSVPVVTTNTRLNLNDQIYIVDMENTSAQQISAYHAAGKKVICYFSAGSWEPFRTDAKSFTPACYCGAGVPTTSDGRCSGRLANQNKLDGWDEWWLDIRSPTCQANIKNVMSQRIAKAKAKGCDGVDPDNVDAYSNKQTFKLTTDDEYNYLLWLSSTAHAQNLTVDLKNAGELLVDDDGATKYQAALVKAFDFNVIESCRSYDECFRYDAFLAAGKPQIQIEYSSIYKTCSAFGLKSGRQGTVYSGTNLVSKQITLDCQYGQK